MIVDLLALSAFLMASAFFSGIEIAFLSVDKLRVEVERKKGSSRGAILANFIEKPSEFLGTTLVGNNIVLVMLSILAGEFLFEQFGIDSNLFWGTIQATLITTVVVLIFGEFLPKVFFQISPTSVLFVFTYPLYLIKILLTPLVWVMIKFSNFIINKLLRISAHTTEQVFTRLDLDHFIHSINRSSEEEIDTTLFQNALYIHTVKVRDCMIPRNEIEAIEINDPIEKLKELFIETRLSRIIVYSESIDNVVGYVHHQKMFDDPKSIQEILWKVPMVYEFTLAQEVMNRLIKENLNLAWVIDERGGTAGIVALEDILEEIFGEIADEHDDAPAEELGVKINENEFVFPGRSEIYNINSDYGLTVPESDEYNTLSGLIVHTYEDIPEQGEKITLGNYEFIVEEVSNTKIEKVRIIKLTTDN